MQYTLYTKWVLIHNPQVNCGHQLAKRRRRVPKTYPATQT